MAIRALIIAVEQYPVLREAIAGDLTGTLQSALAFRRWLIEVKGALAGDLLFCASPRVPEATSGATRDEIRRAILDLRDAGAGDTREFYFFFSGHGYAQTGVGREATANALLAADYIDKHTGDKTLNHDEVIRVLRWLLGPGEHFHFVDVCRFQRREEDFPVGSLTIPARPRDTGQAVVHNLYSTSPGDAARVDSAFGDALVDGLRGKARAKEWVVVNTPPRKLAVRFESLYKYVRDRVQGQKPDPNPSDAGPGIVYEFVPPIAENLCTITVENAGPADLFEVRLADSEQQEIKRETFVGRQYVFHRLPNDYHVAVTQPGGNVEPDGWVLVNLFENDAKTFRVTGVAGGPPPPVSPPPPTLNVRLPVAAAGVLRNLDTGATTPMYDDRKRVMTAGSYRLDVKDPAGWLLRSRSLTLGPGDERTLDLTIPSSPLHEEIIRAVPNVEVGGTVDFSESLGPLADHDPALWLALMGAATIVRQLGDTGDFSRLANLPLPRLDALRPGGSALYLLVGLPAGTGALHIAHSTLARPVPVKWEPVIPVAGFTELSQYVTPMKAGTGLLSLAVGTVSVVTLATAYLPNRATLITVTQDLQGALQVYQLMLPMGHLVDHLPDRVRQSAYYMEGPYGPSRARSVKFILQAQRAYRQRQDWHTAGEASTDELNALLYGKWIDPVMGALAAYELLRRDERGSLLEVADNMQAYFPELPDSHALARLAVERVHSPADLTAADRARFESIMARQATRAGWPIFLDGLAAYDEEADQLPFPAARLDYRGIWTLWRGVVANPTHHSS